MINEKVILCIGAGYVGGPTMAVLADQCPDRKVIVADVNPVRIAAWNSDDLPIYEPGLEDVVRRTRGRNLFFTTDIIGGIKEAGIIFVSVNTPTKTFGEGKGKAADLQYWEQTARTIAQHADGDKIVIEKSTLPVRTAEAMERILNSNSRGLHFDVISNPEFMAEGTAVGDMENPDRVLVGCVQNERGADALAAVVRIYETWVPRERILTTNIWSSELSKLFSNAMLAQRVSSINSISAFCERTAADVREVARAAGMDHRIGSQFMKAGVGFGGSCFKKDILNLVYLCEYYHLPEVAEYWEQVVKINSFQQRRFVNRIVASMFGTLAGKRIAVFGFAFKACTGDTRESPAIAVSRMLLEEKAELAIHDPKALANARLDLADWEASVSFEDDPYAAAAGAHAVAVLTEWPQFADYDYQLIFERMQKPAFIFDGRNILDHKRLFSLGYNVFPLGSQELVHYS